MSLPLTRYACVLGILLLLLSFLTLKVSPLPWYDEVDFTSISHSYRNNRTFICEANDLYFRAGKKEVLYYGPVYFVLNGLLMKWFGFGIIQSRILNFIAGLLCVYLFIRLYERLSGRNVLSQHQALLVLLMLSDYTYLQDMHSGRMDLVALAFILCGLLCANQASRRIWLNFFLSGVFIGIGLLTTPRVYFIVVPYYGYLVFLHFTGNRKNILPAVLLAGVTTSLIYLAWIIGEFGNIKEYITYLNIPTGVFNGSAPGAFFLMYSEIPGYQLVYFMLLLGLVIITSLRNPKSLISIVNIVCLLSVALFLLLAGGSSIYLCLVTGFIYILAIHLGAPLMKRKNTALILLLLLNMGLLSYKYFVVLTSLKGRDPARLDKWVHNVISPGSKVVADDKYYYAVVGAQSEYQYFSRGADINERIAYQANKWKADFLLVGDTISEEFKAYRDNVRISFIKEYKIPGRETCRDAISYRGFLFRFIR